MQNGGMSTIAWSYGAHQSGILVSGCQTNRLSRAISRAVFHSLVSRLFAEQFVDRGDIVGRSATAAIFARDDLFELEQIIYQRGLVIGPSEIIGRFGLQPPTAAEFSRAHLPLAAVAVFLRPYV